MRILSLCVSCSLGFSIAYAAPPKDSKHPANELIFLAQAISTKREWSHNRNPRVHYLSSEGETIVSKIKNIHNDGDGVVSYLDSEILPKPYRALLEQHLNAIHFDSETEKPIDFKVKVEGFSMYQASWSDYDSAALRDSHEYGKVLNGVIVPEESDSPEEDETEAADGEWEGMEEDSEEENEESISPLEFFKSGSPELQLELTSPTDESLNHFVHLVSSKPLTEMISSEPISKELKQSLYSVLKGHSSYKEIQKNYLNSIKEFEEGVQKDFIEILSERMKASDKHWLQGLHPSSMIDWPFREALKDIQDKWSSEYPVDTPFEVQEVLLSSHPVTWDADLNVDTDVDGRMWRVDETTRYATIHTPASGLYCTVTGRTWFFRLSDGAEPKLLAVNESESMGYQGFFVNINADESGHLDWASFQYDALSIWQIESDDIKPLYESIVPDDPSVGIASCGI